MFTRPPECGVLKQHDSHWDSLKDRSCAGWPDAAENVEKLCILAYTWTRAVQMFDPERKLKLVMHPSVLMIIRQWWTPDYTAFVNGQDTPMPPEIEVVIDASLPVESWRFEIASGAMR